MSFSFRDTLQGVKTSADVRCQIGREGLSWSAPATILPRFHLTPSGVEWAEPKGNDREHDYRNQIRASNGR